MIELTLFIAWLGFSIVTCLLCKEDSNLEDRIEKLEKKIHTLEFPTL
jgi:chaperonin cofactor prefoldin